MDIAIVGFGLPEPGGRHFYVRYEEHTLTIPNNSEFSIPQLKMLPRTGREYPEKEDLVRRMAEVVMGDQ
jgi:hypothetical protein